MADFPAMPLMTDAYLGDTLHLGLEEHGAYLKMLMIAWRSPGNCLPDDDRRIATMLGITTARWRSKIRPTIEPFWTISDGVWRQKKLEKVRDFVSKRSAKQSEKANRRWEANSLNGHDTTDAVADAAAMPEPMHPKPKKKDSSSLRSEDPKPHQRMADIWNAESGGLLPSVAKLTEQRRIAMRKRLADDFGGSLEQWRLYCQRIRGSPFLTGENDRAWRADFDWALKPANLVKVLEGKFDRRDRSPANSRTRRDAATGMDTLLRAGTGE